MIAFLLTIIIALSPYPVAESRSAHGLASTARELTGAPHAPDTVPTARLVGGALASHRSASRGLTTSAGGVLSGYATWYATPGHVAAAGPVLRRALGGDPAFRGQSVTVCHDGRCTTVTLSDWCACGSRAGEPTLLDLSATAFRDLAPLDQGVIEVTIRLDAPVPTLPPTDTEETP